MIIKNIDILVIAVGMTIGFSVVVMHLTGLWPCSLINGFEKTFLMNDVHNNNNAKQINSSSTTNSTNKVIYYLNSFFRCS